jgi:hypothetical protein
VCRLHEWRGIDCDFAAKLLLRHKSVDNSDTVEGVEDDIFYQSEHDGHMTFLVNQNFVYMRYDSTNYYTSYKDSQVEQNLIDREGHVLIRTKTSCSTPSEDRVPPIW